MIAGPRRAGRVALSLLSLRAPPAGTSVIPKGWPPHSRLNRRSTRCRAAGARGVRARIGSPTGRRRLDLGLALSARVTSRRLSRTKSSPFSNSRCRLQSWRLATSARPCWVHASPFSYRARRHRDCRLSNVDVDRVSASGKVPSWQISRRWTDAGNQTCGGGLVAWLALVVAAYGDDAPARWPWFNGV
jgi:hypothetical protein